MSLKEELITYLKRNKRLNLDQLYSLCGRERKKISNAERRFRELMEPTHPSYNPSVKAERNAKGVIIAYYWTGIGQNMTYRSDKAFDVIAWNKQFIKPEIKKEESKQQVMF